MANVARDHDSQVEQDMEGRLAEVITALIRSGVLRWSAHAGKPVTKPDQLTADVERWIRHG